MLSGVLPCGSAVMALRCGKSQRGALDHDEIFRDHRCKKIFWPQDRQTKISLRINKRRSCGRQIQTKLSTTRRRSKNASFRLLSLARPDPRREHDGILKIKQSTMTFVVFVPERRYHTPWMTQQCPAVPRMDSRDLFEEFTSFLPNEDGFRCSSKFQHRQRAVYECEQIGTHGAWARHGTEYVAVVASRAIQNTDAGGRTSREVVPWLHCGVVTTQVKNRGGCLCRRSTRVAPSTRRQSIQVSH